MKCPFCKKKVSVVSPCDHWQNRKLSIVEICYNCMKEYDLKYSNVEYIKRDGHRIPKWKADIPASS